MDAALKAVRNAGYEYVEFAEFYGKTAEEINELLKKYSLKLISVHQNYAEMLENKNNILDFFKKIGIKYAAVPYMGKEHHKGEKYYENAVNDLKRFQNS